MKVKVVATFTNVSWELIHSYINVSRKEEKLYNTKMFIFKREYLSNYRNLIESIENLYSTFTNKNA